VKLTKFPFLMILLVGVWITCYDVEDVLPEMIKNTNSASQVDESTDVANKAQLLAFVQFETKVKWKLLLL
jgi:hypothetical protein